MTITHAEQLVTREFHRVNTDTLVPHSITNSLYVVFPADPYGHATAGRQMPVGIVSSTGIPLRKGMVFQDILDELPPPPILDARSDLREVMNCLLLGNSRHASVRDAAGNFLGIISMPTLIETIAGVLGREGTPRDVFMHAIEQSADPVVITNHKSIIQYANRAFEIVSGYARDEVIGKKPDMLNGGRNETDLQVRMQEALQNGKPFHERFMNRRKDGSIFYEDKTISPIRASTGHVTHYLYSSRDITSRARYEEKLEFMAYYDPLTSLPNRLLFTEKLTQAIEQSKRKQAKLAVLFIDLDRFKIIIDTLGHDFGDKLLCVVAKKLSLNLRVADTLARMGGDEFAIILRNVDDPESAVQLARHFQNTFNETFTIDGHECSITASIGITIYPWDGDDTNTLFKNGDTAMNLVKQLGGNGFQLYSKKMSAESEKRLKLETGMRRSLERQDEFVLYYQPQINLYSGEITGLEALIRWKHPELGMISPLEFIPLAEETGLIEPLSELILREASLQTKRWNESGNCNIRTAINISGRQFKKPDFHEFFIRTTKSSQIPLEYLEIEITESSLVGNDEHIIATLETLRSSGISIAIDDFGTGYSSLGYLKRLPIDVLKIDRTFVREITSDPDDASIVYAITTMAHNLGIKAVAEGVETKEQLAFLRACKCDYAQGYYLGRPMRGEDLDQYLQVFGMQSKPKLRGRSQRHTS